MFRKLLRNTFIVESPLHSPNPLKRPASVESSSVGASHGSEEAFSSAQAPYQFVYSRIHDSDALDRLVQTGHQFIQGPRVKVPRTAGPQKFQRGPHRIAQMTGDTVHLIDDLGSLMARMQLVSMNSPQLVCRKTAFSGTGVAEQYLFEVGLLPRGSQLNELDPLRNINLEQTMHCSEQVCAALDAIGLEIRHILYNVQHHQFPLTKPVDTKVLESWESQGSINAAEHDEMKKAVHDHLMTRLSVHWDPISGPRPHADVAAIYKILQRNARENHPIRVLPTLHDGNESSRPAASKSGKQGSQAAKLHVPDRNFVLSMVGESKKGAGLLKDGKGINFTKSVIDRIKRDTAAIGLTMKGHTAIIMQDGFKFWGQAKFGDSVYADPPYLPREQRKKPQNGMNYLSGIREEYTYENWETNLLNEVEQPWDSNVPMLQQNRYVDKLRNLLEYRGWWVSEPAFPLRNKVSGTMELVASNFNEIDGAPAIRKRGYASAISRMAYQNNHRDSMRLTAKCQLDAKIPAYLEAVVIEGWLYAEVEGKITKFAAKDGEPVLPDPAPKSAQRQPPNAYALKIRETEWFPLKHQDSSSLPRIAPEFKPKMSSAATRPSSALALQFKRDMAEMKVEN